MLSGGFGAWAGPCASCGPLWCGRSVRCGGGWLAGRAGARIVSVVGGFAAGRAVVVSPEVVSGSPFAVLGLESTTGVPPLVTEAAVYQVAGGVVRAGPLVWPVAVDAPMVEIPHRSRPNMRFAPPWSRVTGYLLAVLDRRVLVMHDECRLAVLRRHLPDWEPDRVLFTRGLAQRVWPGLDSYDVEPLARAGGISPTPGRRSRRTRS